MTKRLEEEVTPAFHELFIARAFRKEHELYDDQHFGNEVLVFRSPEMGLRFVRDRSEVFVDIGPPDGSNWYRAPRLFEYLHLSADDLYGPADARRSGRLSGSDTFGLTVRWHWRAETMTGHAA